MKLRSCSHFLNKYLIEKFYFCAVFEMFLQRNVYWIVRTTILTGSHGVICFTYTVTSMFPVHNIDF